MQSPSAPLATLDFDGLRPPSPFMTELHESWRARVRDFVIREILPHLSDWEATGTFPDALFESAARQGLLGIGFPERLGGHTEDADPYYRVIFSEELHRPGSGVVFADLATHWIGLPPVIQFGSEELLETVARPVLAGKRRIAFAVTEPSGGSDAGALQTRAERREGHWLVNGTKTLISGAMRADYILAAVRTGGAGAGGISLLLIDAASPGIARQSVPGLRLVQREQRHDRVSRRAGAARSADRPGESRLRRAGTAVQRGAPERHCGDPLDVARGRRGGDRLEP